VTGDLLTHATFYIRAFWQLQRTSFTALILTMIFELTTPTLVALSAIIYYACLWVYSGRRLRSKGLRLPPGPKGKHFVGNLHQISRIEPWLTFAEWGKEYGEPL